MGEQWFRTCVAADESPHVAMARKVGAIVATLTASTIMRSGIGHGGSSVGVTTRFAGYLHGFSEIVCAAWAITDARVAIDATRFALVAIFPQTLDHPAEWMNPENPAPCAFYSGSRAGRADGERYVTSGRSGMMLLAMLAED